MVIVTQLRGGRLPQQHAVSRDIDAATQALEHTQRAGLGGVDDEGEIHAPSVIINGAVEGNVHSTKHLELASKARVQGNVYYTLVEMAAGAEVNGSLAHVAEPDVAKGKKKDSPAVAAGPGDHPASLAVVSAKLD